ncbi:MAG: hypothetical protein QM776_09135 [Rhodocyclaceae bacterium]
MSHRMSWISVAAKPRNEVLNELGFVDSGEEVAPGTTAMAVATSAEGACIIVFDDFWDEQIQLSAIYRLTGHYLAIGCSEAESVNASMACLYRAGTELWTVSHILDEGALHLEVTGTPPNALTSLMNRARKRHEQDGHDAVFSVPGALAEQVSGFSWARRHELRFTRLDAMPALNAEHIVRELQDCMTGLLKADGFQTAPSGEPSHLIRDTDRDHLEVGIQCYTGDPNGGVGFDARFMLSNHYVQSFIDRLGGYTSTETAVLSLSDCMSLPYRSRTSYDLATVLAALRREVPSILQRLSSYKALDRLLNDGRQRYTLHNEPTSSHFDLRTGHSNLIVAYLASNPKFEQMVRECDEGTTGGANPANNIHRLAADLRKHGVREN